MSVLGYYRGSPAVKIWNGPLVGRPAAADPARDPVNARALDELEVDHMLAARLVQPIEIHAEGLTREVPQDLATNARTPSFRNVPRDDAVRAEYEKWVRRRFRQGMPLSESVYALPLRPVVVPSESEVDCVMPGGGQAVITR